MLFSIVKFICKRQAASQFFQVLPQKPVRLQKSDACHLNLSNKGEALTAAGK